MTKLAWSTSLPGKGGVQPPAPSGQPPGRPALLTHEDFAFPLLSATADGDGNLEEPRAHEQTKPAAYHGRIRATLYEDGPLSRAAAGKRAACCCPYQRSRAAELPVGLIPLPPAPGLSLVQCQSSEQRGHGRSTCSKFLSFRKCV